MAYEIYYYTRNLDQRGQRNGTTRKIRCISPDESIRCKSSWEGNSPPAADRIGEEDHKSAGHAMPRHAGGSVILEIKK
jgi:hypothetical protein